MSDTTSPGIFPQIFKLTKHSAIYAISSIIQKLPGLILLPIYTNTNYLPSRSDFGDYALIFTFVAFMYFVYLYGMDSSLMRYFFLGGHDRRSVFSSISIMLLVTGAIVTGILIIFSPSIAELLLKNESYQPFILIAALILFFDSIGNLPFIILRAEEKSIQFTLFRMVRFILEMFLNILFVVILRKGVIGILYANLAASVINLIIMLPIMFRYFIPKIDFTLWKEMLWFGLPFLPNGIAYMAIETVDRFLVQEYLGKDAVGLYSPNYKFGTALLMLVIAFRNAWQPFFLKIADQSNAKEIYSRILTYFVISCGLITLFGTFFIKDVLTVYYFNSFYILGQAYWDGIPLIPVIFLSYFFFGIYVILTPGFYIKKKSSFMIVFTGSGAVLNIVVNIILLPKLYIWGAAIATLVSYFTMAFTIYIISNKIYPIKIEWKPILKMILLMGLMFLLFYQFNLNILARSLMGIFAFFYAYIFVLGSRERGFIKNKILKFGSAASE
jgi:O-antigen/teichoic acid export membrane protein